MEDTREELQPQAPTPAEPEPETRPPEDAAPSETPSADETSAAPDYVRMTLDAGVPPLEMRFSQINHCYRRLPIAYRSFTYINSVIDGVIPPEKYSFAADRSDRGLRIAKWNLVEAMKAVRKFEEAGRHVEFVTARCPASLALEPDLYGWVKTLMEENDFHTPEKLCMEFPRTLLFKDEETVRASVLSMKLLKVRTMLSGCGEKDCPVTLLLNVPVDLVLLAPWVSALADSRNKGVAVAALLAFLRSLPCEVIGDGLYNDQQISVFSRAECFGYIPSSGYNGVVSHGRLRMPLDEAIAQKEEEEF